MWTVVGAWRLRQPQVLQEHYLEQSDVLQSTIGYPSFRRLEFAISKPEISDSAPTVSMGLGVVGGIGVEVVGFGVL